MGKMMSFLEKYNIIEKSVSEERQEVQEEVIEEAPLSAEETSLEINPAAEESLEEEATENDKGEDTMATENNENSHFCVQKKMSVPVQPTTEMYHANQSIDSIYHYAGLTGKAVTDTAFYLESLIQALPNELPEYVKKTTIDNIISASNIDINKLIADGRERFRQLDNFQDSFSSTNYAEITALKQEIEKLTAAITNYHQEIKQKELLVQEEAALIEAEKNRLSHILTFFEGK